MKKTTNKPMCSNKNSETINNTLQLNKYQTEMLLIALSKTTGSTFDDECSCYISNNDLVSLKNKLSKHLKSIKKNSSV